MLTGSLLGLLLLAALPLLAREILPVRRFVIAAVPNENGTILGTFLPSSFSLAGAIRPALLDPEQNAASVFRLAANMIVPYSADELCNELLEHMLDCHWCLSTSEDTCSAYRCLHQRIALHSGPRKGVIFAL
jgi:hypothetical protein